MTPLFRDSLALLFASVGPLVMAWLGFVVFAGEVDRGQSLLFKIYSFGKVIQFAFPLLYVAVFERSQLLTLKLAARGLVMGVAFGVIVDLGMAGVYFGVLRNSPAITDTPGRIFGKLQELGVATPGGYLAIGLFLCAMHSLLEEYYWRWFVFGSLKRYLSLGLAIAISSVGFMAHHVVILYVYFPGRFWTIVLPLSLGVAVGGAVWAWMYRRSDSLLGPWLSHILVDAGIMLIGYDLLREYWNGSIVAP